MLFLILSNYEGEDATVLMYCHLGLLCLMGKHWPTQKKKFEEVL